MADELPPLEWITPPTPHDPRHGRSFGGEAFRQGLAGILSTPSDAVIMLAGVADPVNTVRRMFVGPSPMDQAREEIGQQLGVGGDTAQTIPHAMEAVGRGINNMLDVEQPTFTSDPAMAGVRIGAGALLPLPLRVGAIRGAIPTAAEALTPLTVFNRGATPAATALNYATGVAANTGTQAAAQAAIESALTPAGQQGPVGNIGDAIRDNPGAAAAIAATGLLGFTGLRNILRAQQATQQLATSRFTQPSGAQPETPSPLPTRVVNEYVDSTAAARQAIDQAAGTTVPDRLRATVGAEPRVLSEADYAAREAQYQRDLQTNPQAQRAPLPPEQVIAGVDAAKVPEIHAAIHMASNEPAIASKMHAAANEGHFVLSDGRSMRVDMPLGRVADEVAQLSQADPTFAKRYNDTIAMRSELNNRDRNALADRPKVVEVDPNTGQIIQVRTQRPNFYSVSDQQLRSRIGFHMQDPNIARLVDAHNTNSRTVMKYLVSHGYFTPADARRMMKVNPDYLHMIDLEKSHPSTGLVLRAKGERAGGDTVYDPIMAQGEYLAYVMHAVEVNNMRRAVLEPLTNYSHRNIGRINQPQITGRVLGPGETSKLPTITYRRGGHPITVEVLNKQVHATLKATPQLASTIMSDMRKFWQSGTTGTLATATLQPFAAVSAMYQGLIAGLTRPRGTHFGYIDQLAQYMGLKAGVRGDFTSVLGMAHAAAADSSMILTRAFRDAARASLMEHGTLVKLFGEQQVRSAADAAAKLYARSNYERAFVEGQQSRGVLGGGDPDRGRSNVMSTASRQYDQLRNTGKPTTYEEWTTELTRKVPAQLRSAYAIFDEIVQAIGNSPGSYYDRANRGKLNANRSYGEQQIHAREVRSLGGDAGIVPGVLKFQAERGNVKKAIAGVYGAVPFANVGVQGINRLGQAVKRDPLGFATGVAMWSGTAATAAIVSAVKADRQRMEAGQEPIYVPYLLNRPAYQQTTSIPLFINGIEPEMAPSVNIEPSMRWAYTLVYEGIVRLLGLHTDSRNNPNALQDRRALEDIAAQRTSSNISNAVTNAVPFTSPPPIVTAAGAAMGIEVPSLDRLVERGGAMPLPSGGMGGMANTRLADDVFNRRVESVIGALTGSAGMTVMAALREAAFSAPGQGARNALATAAARGEDRLPIARPLFGREANVTLSNPVAERLNQKVNMVREINTNLTAIHAPGTIGSGRFMEYVGTGGRQGIPDPQVREVLSAVSSLQRTTAEMTAERNRIRDAMLVNERTIRDPNERRVQNNNLAYDYRQVTSRMLAVYNEVEHNLSQRYGRRIRIEHIQPFKGMDQFPSLR